MTTIPVSAQAAPAVRWKDKKRYLWLLGLVVPLLPFGAWDAYQRTGVELALWFGPMWIFLGIPLFDALTGEDTSNPPEAAVPALEADHWYRWCTYLYLPLQFASLLFGCWLIVNGDLSWFGQLGLALTVGTVAGVGINTAHELGHKKEKVERRLSKVALAQSGYGHFYVEHNRGHHLRVATPEDPASSRVGESFWRFLPRTVIGSFRSAWSLERTRLTAQGKKVWSTENDNLTAWALSVVLFGALIVGFGVAIVPFLVVQAVFGFCLLEIVNYIEHYGLLRQKTETGRYEKCRYQALRHFDDSPQLPNGYGGMIGLALFPPIWRRVMDHRVVEHYGGDITLANIQPAKREQLLAKYPVS
jgi:alkane 1-monooxygenase